MLMMLILILRVYLKEIIKKEKIYIYQFIMCHCNIKNQNKLEIQ